MEEKTKMTGIITMIIGNKREVSETKDIKVEEIRLSEIPSLIYRYQSLPGINVTNFTIYTNWRK